jgi:hypothetical protein
MQTDNAASAAGIGRVSLIFNVLGWVLFKRSRSGVPFLCFGDHFRCDKEKDLAVTPTHHVFEA